MCGTAAAASSRSTVMRTSSEPARGQRRDLARGAFDIGRVGVGHRLDDDRRAAADLHAADFDRDDAAPRAAGLRFPRLCFGYFIEVSCRSRYAPSTRAVYQI